MAIVVVPSTRVAEQRAVCSAVFRGRALERIPTCYFRELASLRRRLKQVLTDIVHSIRVSLFRVSELVNPDRLRHVVPPGLPSTVAHAKTRKHLPGGADVRHSQPVRRFRSAR